VMEKPGGPREGPISCSPSRRSPAPSAPGSATRCATPLTARTSPPGCGNRSGSCTASRSAMASTP
jgi:hypothetical protein